jgi:hypothetical protein
VIQIFAFAEILDRLDLLLCKCLVLLVQSLSSECNWPVVLILHLSISVLLLVRNRK